jgi:DNA-binding LacI/PurR family transcriptional regulator
MGRPNRSLPLVKHDHISGKLQQMIEQGAYSPGDFLPPERILAEQFSVSRPTLRKALAALVEIGLLVNHPGLGTRVATPGRSQKANRGNWRVIGLLIPDFDNQFFIEVTESIEYTALQRGYQVLLCNSRHEPGIEEAHLQQLASQQVDGVIMAHDPHTPFPAAVSLLREAGIPFLALFSSPSASDCDGVVLDDKAGVEQVMRYLMSLGHRHIAFCRPVPGSLAHPREQAYLEFMDQNKLRVPPHFLIPYGLQEERASLRNFDELFKKAPAPTAIFAGNDHVALVAMKNLGLLGKEIPREVSIAGFDNLRFTEHLAIPLTTIDQPKQEMGRRAVELLLERIEFGVSPQARIERFQPHLVIRESCAIVSSNDFVAPRNP